MELVLQTISDAAFFKDAGESVALPCNISIVSLEGESDPASTMDALEEGSIESDKSGRRIISRVEREWTDKPTSIDQSVSNEMEIVTTESIASQHGQTLEESLDNVLAIAPTTQVDNARDEYVKDTNKSLYQRDVEKTISESPAAVNVNATSIAHEVDTSEVATADDIASLFSTVKSAIQPLESVSAAVVVPTTPKVSLPTEAMLCEIATADDIALLFQNATASALKTAEVRVNSSPLPTGEQLSDPATMEDIAALFDSVKSSASTEAQP